MDPHVFGLLDPDPQKNADPDPGRKIGEKLAFKKPHSFLHNGPRVPIFFQIIDLEML